jgi:hypothetical protein
MPFNNLDLKRVYYYVICVMAFFVLMWGMVDFASSSIGLLNIRGSATSFSAPSDEAIASPEKGEQFFDAYYQRKMLYDRFWDSLVRILVPGLIFAYCRYTINKLEKQE